MESSRRKLANKRHTLPNCKKLANKIRTLANIPLVQQTLAPSYNTFLTIVTNHYDSVSYDILEGYYKDLVDVANELNFSDLEKEMYDI